MKVLVTGATGFVGRRLLAALGGDGEPFDIHAVARRTPAAGGAGVSWIEADLSRPEWTARLPEESYDIVVHLAQSEHYRHFPDRAPEILQVNVHATMALAEWARRHGVRRFVFASTGSVYGSSDRVHAEDHECRPETMYAASKLAGETLLKPYAPFMEILALRLFAAYGPGQTNAMLPGVIARFDSGGEITLAGNVGVRFNPIFVDDCSAVIRRLLACPSTGFEILNVCGPEVVDLRDAVAILEAASGRTARVRVTDDSPVRLVGCTRKMDALCGPRQGVSFRDGLSRMYHAACAAPRME